MFLFYLGFKFWYIKVAQVLVVYLVMYPLWFIYMEFVASLAGISDWNPDIWRGKVEVDSAWWRCRWRCMCRWRWRWRCRWRGV